MWTSFIRMGKPKNPLDSLYCVICFIAMIWNWTHSVSEVCLYPAQSLCFATSFSFRHFKLLGSSYVKPKFWFLLIDPSSLRQNDCSSVPSCMWWLLLCSYKSLISRLFLLNIGKFSNVYKRRQTSLMKYPSCPALQVLVAPLQQLSTHGFVWMTDT